MGRWDGPPSIRGTGARSRGCLNGSLNLFTPTTNVLSYRNLRSHLCKLLHVDLDIWTQVGTRPTLGCHIPVFAIQCSASVWRRGEGGQVPAAESGSSF